MEIIMTIKELKELNLLDELNAYRIKKISTKTADEKKITISDYDAEKIGIIDKFVICCKNHECYRCGYGTHHTPSYGASSPDCYSPMYIEPHKRDSYGDDEHIWGI